MISKELICKKFGNASSTYDLASLEHQKIVDHLVHMISKQQYIWNQPSIIDIGAGTGLLSEKISRLFPNSSISLLDISQDMLDVAFQKNTCFKDMPTEFKYINMDAEKIDFQFFERFDLLVSSMSMQWFNDLSSFLLNSFKYCKKIAFSIPISGTFQDWYDLLNEFDLKFRTIGYKTYDEMIEICNACEFAHSVIETKKHIIEFKSTRDFIKYLKHIGADIGEYTYNFDSLKKLLKLDQKMSVSYNVFYAVLLK